MLLHDRFAALARAFADTSTHFQRRVVVLEADGRVHGAEEEFQLGRALDLDQRPELVHLEASLFLRLLVQFIGHAGHVVTDTLAHWYRDQLATTGLGKVWSGAAGAGAHYNRFHVALRVG